MTSRLFNPEPGYLRLRLALWPDSGDDDVAAMLADVRTWAVFVSRDAGGRITGFVEAHLREYADGASSSPVGYLEGWYVAPEHRRNGVGRLLVQAAEAWARSQGCSEMASDTDLHNATGIRAHERLGYKEESRVVQFLKRLS